MDADEVEAIVDRLVPQILVDRQLGNGRRFTPRHLRRLWALTCLHTGECIEEAELVEHVCKHLPPRVLLEGEVAAI